MTNHAIRMRRARRDDVPAIARLLADDHLGGAREEPDDLAPYLAAFDRIDGERRQLLAVAEDHAGAIVGALQLTFIPGLSNQGAELALLSAVRIDSRLRAKGLGSQMLGWAMDEARRRGCASMELLSHASREDARRFYERHGFAASHVGMKRGL